MGKLLLLFTIVPLIELYLLMRLAAVMGFVSTVLLVLVTGVLGASLAKAEGMRVIRTWQRSLSQGQVPEEGVVGGLLVLVGGVLLVTPGVLTDALGLCLLIPRTRRWLSGVVRAAVQRGIENGRIHVTTSGFSSTGFPGTGFPGAGYPGADHPSRRSGHKVIEVESHVVERGDE